jgi:hypothetical protein
VYDIMCIVILLDFFYCLKCFPIKTGTFQKLVLLPSSGDLWEKINLLSVGTLISTQTKGGIN